MQNFVLLKPAYEKYSLLSTVAVSSPHKNNSLVKQTFSVSEKKKFSMRNTTPISSAILKMYLNSLTSWVYTKELGSFGDNDLF